VVGAARSAQLSAPLVCLEEGRCGDAGSIKAPVLGDLWHAAAAIHTEHYEIAAYRQLVLIAEALGNEDLGPLLAENLAEEEQALGRLEQVALGMSTRATGAR